MLNAHCTPIRQHRPQPPSRTTAHAAKTLRPRQVGCHREKIPSSADEASSLGARRSTTAGRCRVRPQHDSRSDQAFPVPSNRPKSRPGRGLVPWAHVASSARPPEIAVPMLRGTLRHCVGRTGNTAPGRPFSIQADRGSWSAGARSLAGDPRLSKFRWTMAPQPLSLIPLESARESGPHRGPGRGMPHAAIPSVWLARPAHIQSKPHVPFG